MSTTTPRSDGVVCVPRTGTLYDVLELILDRGMVIDVFVRVSLVGIEILKIDARVVVASVDTYLRFAEACNRLDLESDERSRTVPELFGAAPGRAKSVGAKKAAKAVGGKVKEAVGAGSDEDDEEEEEAEASAEPPRKSRSGTRSRAVGASRTRRSQER
jgi:gas vesicle structural protein